MCGIVGSVSQSPIADHDLLIRMRDAMRHRGPDDAGVWWSPDGCVGLAQRRLAIIDLSPGGHQPMLDASGELCISFNGEIYNFQDLRRELEARGHRFRTASDTEVILEAYREWGDDFIQRLNGMFAFALYDLKRRRVLMARDRAGEKPLFYCHTEGRLIFASELKALMADPTFLRVLEGEALAYYLAYGYVPGDKCILKGVHKLPPAHALAFDLNTNRLRIWRYWQLPDPPNGQTASAPELLEELEALLLDSVRMRMIADVPVGVLLSGGIDSSLITAMAARISSKPVKTFTISFPGHGTYDEAPYARMVAQHFGTEHIEMEAEPATVELLPQLARQYDEPMADSSMIPTYLVSRLIRQHATVALGGDGGDELFGGYPHYSWVQWQERVRGFIPRGLRRAVGTGAARWLPPGFKGRNYLIGFSADLVQSLAHVNVYFDAITRERLLAPMRFQGHAVDAYKERLCISGYSPLQQATRLDFQTTMVDAYLVKVDRASMLNSLEVRVPWLDHRLVEFAFGRVPDSLKATESERKILSRRLAERLLPRELDLKRKQGFSMPLDAWFKGEWGKYVEDVLRQADPNLFDQPVIHRLIADQRRGYANTARLFALTLFELWRREYQVTMEG